MNVHYFWVWSSDGKNSYITSYYLLGECLVSYINIALYPCAKTLTRLVKLNKMVLIKQTYHNPAFEVATYYFSHFTLNAKFNTVYKTGNIPLLSYTSMKVFINSCVKNDGN